MSAAVILKSIALFVIAGLCEIGGGYLVWLWLRDGRAAILGAAGGLILLFCGIVPTFQPAHFGRGYASSASPPSSCTRVGLEARGTVATRKEVSSVLPHENQT